jgi:hypothetical protein
LIGARSWEYRTEMGCGDQEGDDQHHDKHRQDHEQIEQPGGKAMAGLGERARPRGRASDLSAFPGRTPPCIVGGVPRKGRRQSVAGPVCAVPVAQPSASIRVGVPVRRGVQLCQQWTFLRMCPANPGK